VIDPRLEYASTLPSRCYFDADVLAEENRRIFARTWQLAGPLEQVREPGQYFTTTIADEPLLVVRSGKRPVLQCGYHGWTYGLDGKLLVTPEFEGVQDFDRASCTLPQFGVEVWNELVFVNLEPAETLPEFLGELLTDMPRHDYSGFRLAHRKVWELDCNWKVYVDNYLEGYHIPIVHPGLFRELDYPNYRTETRRTYSIQFAPTRRPERIRTADGNDEVAYFWVFPNLMLNVYPDNFSTNLIVPLGPRRTATLFDWYFKDPDAARQQIDETVQFSDEIQIEDINICEAVQRGLGSTTYDRGRFSPKRENGVHHFHLLYEEMMNDLHGGFARSTR
jgi:choline monooxygenase